MDAHAVSAALTPAALAPAIAKRLGLPPADVETALGLLAQGAQPAFIARHRGDRVKELRIEDLEQIQSAAAQAVGFELRRQQVAVEVAQRGAGGPLVARELAAASHPLDLDDVRTFGTRKKRPASVRARIGGLTPLALALWKHGSDGDFTDAVTLPADLLAVPGRAALGKKRKRRRKKKADADAEVAAAQMPTEEEGDEDSADSASEVGDGVEAHGTEDVEADASDAEGEDASIAEGTSDDEHEPSEDTHAPAQDEIPSFDGEALAAAVSADTIPDDAQAIADAKTICADFIVEHPGVRRLLRRLVMTRGKLRTAVVPGKQDKAGRYGKFFDRAEVCSSMAPTNVLAVQRAERDGLLDVSIEVDVDMLRDEVAKLLGVAGEGAAAAALREAIEEACVHGGLAKAISGGVRRQMKERADRALIPNLCDALRPQLLAPAFGRRPVLCIDPGTQHGCRLVVLSAEGRLVVEDTVFPLQPKLQVPQAKARIAELCGEHGVQLIVVVGSTGAREVEKLARVAIAESEAVSGIPVHTVDGEGVGSLAGSKSFKTELPKADAATRRAVCAGRRVQDPLLALARADLRKLSLGQFQFDVDPEGLRQALEQVVGTCIAKVGVDLGTVDTDTLARVQGM